MCPECNASTLTVAGPTVFDPEGAWNTEQDWCACGHRGELQKTTRRLTQEEQRLAEWQALNQG